MKGLLLLLSPVIMAAIIIGLVWAACAYDCWADFSDGKYDYRYKLLKGCQYQSTTEGWLPEKRLRNLN